MYAHYGQKDDFMACIQESLDYDLVINQRKEAHEMDTFISWSLTSDDIYDDEGDVVGSEEYALIEKLYVNVADRGQGVGRELLVSTLADIAQQYPGVCIKVAALPFGEDAIDMTDLVAFYESVGFDVEDTNGPAVIMTM